MSLVRFPHEKGKQSNPVTVSLGDTDNNGSSNGRFEGKNYSEGDLDGLSDDLLVGALEGSPLTLGDTNGSLEGESDRGLSEGNTDGRKLGTMVGMWDGNDDIDGRTESDGDVDGSQDGACIGTDDIDGPLEVDGLCKLEGTCEGCDDQES